MALPTIKGGWACILADPPWRFATWSAKGRDRCPDGISRARQRENNPARHYETMDLGEIRALPVYAVAAKDAVLFLWAVDSMLPQALHVGEAWGFQFKTVAFYWAKLRTDGSTRRLLHNEPEHKLFPMGTGFWTRSNPEICLLFSRGKPKRLSASERKLIIEPRREHSRKPDGARERIERLVAGPRLELFARQSRPGWTVWGDQSTQFDHERRC